MKTLDKIIAIALLSGMVRATDFQPVPVQKFSLTNNSAVVRYKTENDGLRYRVQKKDSMTNRWVNTGGYIIGNSTNTFQYIDTNIQLNKPQQFYRVVKYAP